MTDRGVITDELSVPQVPVAENGALPDRAEALEERVCRLENAVAGLQDTRRLEERIVERLAARWNRGSAGPETTGIFASTGRKLLPIARQVMQTGGAAFEDSPPDPSQGRRQPWFLFDFYYEVQAMVRMFFDRRFRVGWMGRVVPIAALTLFIISWFFIASIRLIGPLLDRVFEIVLVCIVYKVLSREAQRYRQFCAGMPSAHDF